MQSRNINYVGALDQLRGLAAFQILFYHSFHLIGHQLAFGKPFTTEYWPLTSNPIAPLIIEGHTAVAMFMVLSGFIFTIGTYSSTICYKNFVLNRALRTFPLFILMIFSAMAIRPENEDLYKLLLTITTFSQSPEAIQGAPFSLMFWAISVEWQFYLIFPFLITIFKKDGLRFVFGLIVLMLIFRWLLSEFGASPRDISYWKIWGRLDQFLIGMVAGSIYTTSFRKGFAFDILALASSACLIAYLYLFNHIGGWPMQSVWKIVTPTIEGLIWAGFILGYLSISRLMPKPLATLIQSIGVISYSVYLLHTVIIDLCIRNGFIFDHFKLGPVGDTMVTTVIIVIPITLVLCTLTYNFIEKPFLSMRKSYKKEDEPTSLAS